MSFFLKAIGLFIVVTSVLLGFSALWFHLMGVTAVSVLLWVFGIAVLLGAAEGLGVESP